MDVIPLVVVAGSASPHPAAAGQQIGNPLTSDNVRNPTDVALGLLFAMIRSRRGKK
jgi:hypothetical protein